MLLIRKDGKLYQRGHLPEKELQQLVVEGAEVTLFNSNLYRYMTMTAEGRWEVVELQLNKKPAESSRG